MVVETLSPKLIGVMTWPLRVTWLHRSIDHSIRHRPFYLLLVVLGGTETLYLLPFSSYWALGILESRPWRSMGDFTSSVTWPFDPQIVISSRCSINLQPSFIFNRCRDNGSQIYWIRYLNLSWSCDVISHVIIWFPSTVRFLLVLHCNQVRISSYCREYGFQIKSESWPWPFRVIWRQRSWGHSIRRTPFPIGALLEPSLCLYRISRYSPGPRTLSDTMLNRHCTCTISRDM